MNKLLLVSIFLLTGCATAVVVKQSEVTIPAKPPKYRTENHNRIAQVKPEMTKEQVQVIMLDTVVVGLAKQDDQWVQETLKNPHRVEALAKGSKRYDIYYYITKIYKQDGMVSDDELMPIVFKDDVVVGIGWDAFKKIK